jgi:hypothetical protein
MSYQEKSILLGLPVDFALVLGYTIWLLGQLQQTSRNSVDYGWTLIGFIALGAVINIAVQIVLAIVLHRQANLEDVRDREIKAKANSITLFFLGAPFFLAIGLGIVQADYFDIVHVLYYGGALATMVNSFSRLYYYRRGMRL